MTGGFHWDRLTFAELNEMCYDKAKEEWTMCVAIPAKVISVDNGNAIVDYRGNTVKVNAGLVKVKPGDSVLVHAGCILQVLSDFDRDMLLELLEEME